MQKKILTLALAGALVCSANAVVLISEVDLANDKVELVNNGPSAVDFTGWWWCNRVNGSPFYSQVTSYAVDAGLSSAGASLTNFGVGQTLVLSMTDTILRDTNGELGLYTTNSFGSASAIEDYVLWGANGIRDIVAQNAGLWTNDDEIDISGILPGETLQMLPSTTGNGSAEWTIGAGTLGSVNVPEPSTYALLAGLLVLAAVVLRRRG